MGVHAIPGYYWAIFFVGAVVMRSAGCIYNDLVDRSFDGNVQRTKLRPLVRPHKPLSLKVALVFLGVNLCIGLGCLLMLNHNAIYIGIISAVLIALYPWMKRITYWPQLFLGFTMNMGFLIGAAAVNALDSLYIALFYVGMVLWTLGYDTIYGFQDIDDDVLIGVKSSSIKIRNYAHWFIGLCYVGAVVFWGISVYIARYHVSADFVLVVVVSVLGWQATTMNIQDSANCLQRFRSNQWVSMLLFLIGLLSVT